MSASKIQSTTNYNRFKFMEGNRPVNSARVRKLIKSIKRKNMLQQFPIVCQKNGTGLYIMDGQHRYTAAVSLKLPVFFVEGKNIEIEDVAATNSAQKGWNVNDFVASYAAQGNQHYIELADFMTRHGLPAFICANMLGGKCTDGGSTISGLVSSGQFVVTDAAFANRVASAVSGCLVHFKGAKDARFVSAIARLIGVKGFSITRFIQKLETQSTKMVKCASTAQYIELIEEIYNYRARADDIVALSIEVKRQLAKKGE